MDIFKAGQLPLVKFHFRTDTSDDFVFTVVTLTDNCMKQIKKAAKCSPDTPVSVDAKFVDIHRFARGMHR